MADLSKLVETLQEAAQAYADTIFAAAAADGVREMWIGPPPDEPEDLLMPGWSEPVDGGFRIAMKFPNGKWYVMVQPGTIFREALVHYLLATRGIDMRTVPLTGQVRVGTPHGTLTWDVDAASKDAAIHLRRIASA